MVILESSNRKTGMNTSESVAGMARKIQRRYLALILIMNVLLSNAINPQWLPPVRVANY